MWHLQMRAATRELTARVTRLANLARARAAADAGRPRRSRPPLAVGFEGNALTSDRDAFAWCVGQITAHPELALGGPSDAVDLARRCEEMARLYVAPLPTPADARAARRRRDRGLGER